MMIDFTPESEKVRYKSPPIVAAVGVSAIALAAFMYPELAAQPIVHYRADGNSLSADRCTLQRQTRCQLSSQHYQPGDTAVSIPFADRAAVTKSISIANSLTLMGECQHSGRSITNKQPGTSFVMFRVAESWSIAINAQPSNRQNRA